MTDFLIEQGVPLAITLAVLVYAATRAEDIAVWLRGVGVL